MGCDSSSNFDVGRYYMCIDVEHDTDNLDAGL